MVRTLGLLNISRSGRSQLTPSSMNHIWVALFFCWQIAFPSQQKIWLDLSSSSSPTVLPRLRLWPFLASSEATGITRSQAPRPCGHGRSWRPWSLQWSRPPRRFGALGPTTFTNQRWGKVSIKLGEMMSSKKKGDGIEIRNLVLGMNRKSYMKPMHFFKVGYCNVCSSCKQPSQNGRLWLLKQA